MRKREKSKSENIFWMQIFFKVEKFIKTFEHLQALHPDIKLFVANTNFKLNMATFATDEDNESIYTLENTQFTVNSKITTGGLLTISSASFRWQKADENLDYEYKWQNIMLHAVVREDVEKPRIFIQLDDNSEVHLTPAEDVCDDIFAAMCKAAEMNPDEESKDDENGGWFTRGDDDAKLAGYDALLSGAIPGQFDDAVVPALLSGAEEAKE